MIQFSGTGDDGKRFVGIGLSDGNLRRLRDGEPAVVDMEAHGFPGSKVVIFYGRTEEEMELMVKKNFIVGKPQ